MNAWANLFVLVLGFGLLIAAFTLLPIAALLLLPAIATYMYLNSEAYKEKQAKNRTLALYEQARHLDVPPPPPVANSVAGARYRDMLSDAMSGHVKPDPIPIQSKRFEHVHMVAGSGHGKTQAMQHFVLEDLKHLNERSVIVIDSQRQMIENILQLQIPKEKIVYINPRDRDYLPALNLFDNVEATNAAIEIYEYIMGGILGAELTSKQGVVFRFVIRLMLTIPGANIDTLSQVFQDHTRFASFYNKIGGPTQEFFETEFSKTQYNDTRAQVLRRIFTVKENETLYRMFSAPESRLRLGDEMDGGKVILIDTAKDALKEEGARILGRFFIAKIVQAAQERTGHRFPVHVYIDEAQDYFDDRTEILLSQLRKQRVGGFFTHQYLGQLPSKLQEAFMANTSTKIAGGVSLKDARALAGEMKVDPHWIADQPEGHFVVFVKGMPQGMSTVMPFFEMEKAPKRNDMEELITYQRNRYAALLKSVSSDPDEPNDEEDGKSFRL